MRFACFFCVAIFSMAAPGYSQGSSEKKDAAAPAENLPMAPEGAAETISPNGSQADPLSYTYNPFGKRDPFRPFTFDKGDDKTSLDPLVAFELSKYSLTGIIWGISNPRAIIKDGNGHGHIISRGTKIGRNKGQVVQILKDALVVAEEFRDPLGKLLVTETTLKLRTTEGKK